MASDEDKLAKLYLLPRVCTCSPTSLASRVIRMEAETSFWGNLIGLVILHTFNRDHVDFRV